MWGAIILVLIAVNHFTSRWQEARRLAQLRSVGTVEGRPPQGDTSRPPRPPGPPGEETV